MLEPIDIEINSKKGYVIIFKCKKCGAIRKNKVAEDDNMELIYQIVKNKSLRWKKEKRLQKKQKSFVISFIFEKGKR